MSYCQDCGAYNEDGRIDCRVCGRMLQHDQSSTSCSVCGQLLGVDAAFCSACGAPVPLGLGMARSAGMPPASGPSPAGLGEGLNLPDWLKQAATQTPPAPIAGSAAPPQPLMPAGFVIAGDAAARTPAAPGPSANDFRQEHLPPPTRPTPAGAGMLPPLPDHGLSAAMPAWLQAPPPPVTPLEDRLVAPPTLPPAAPARPKPASRSSDSPTTPAGFINENDLPVWIRELVAKEQAEAEEAARVAAETDALARAHAEAAARAQGVAGGTRSLHGRPGAGPAEGVESAVVARPRSWLTRGEATSGRAAQDLFRAASETDTERTSVFAEVVETRSRALGTDRLRMRPELMKPEDAPSAATASAPATQPPAAPAKKSAAPAKPAKAPKPPRGDSKRSLAIPPMRLALIVAVVVALLLVVMMMMR